jgi:sodium/potassium-transporting ATPase subunit alpha
MRRIQTIGRDTLGRDSTRGTENQERAVASKLRRILNHLNSPFTKMFWLDLLDSSDGEKLVDMGLMSYAYLEAGLIEAIGP